MPRIPSLVVVLGALAVLFVACSDDDNGPSQPNDPYQATIDQFGLAPLPASIPYPPDNPHIPERILLGKLLFFDPILGGESAPWVKSAAGKDPYRFRGNDVACATCHHPSLGFADGRRLGAGVGGSQYSDIDLGPDRVVPAKSLVSGNPVGTEPRNSPSILNTAFNGKASFVPTFESFQFMDGRVTNGLEGQAKLPITSRDEMAGDAYFGSLTKEDIQDSVAARVAAIPEYVQRFRQAFGSEVRVASDITIDHVARAIAAYERELVTPGSRYDKFVGGDRDAFDDQEKRGFELFFGKGLCGDCHSGPMLSDFSFRVQGVAEDYDATLPGFAGKNLRGGDWGRFHADEVAFAGNKFEFRVLTVRNAEITGPYFHAGNAGTLRELMDFYNRGGRGPTDISDAMLAAEGKTRDPSITELNLTDQEMEDIIAFMLTTTAPVKPGPSGVDLTAVPTRVPSGLVPPGIPTPPGPGPFKPEPGSLP